MNKKQKISAPPWLLILSLGAFALIRPAIKILGDIFGYEVPSIATIAITAIIAAAWITIVVKLKISRPVIVLALSGATYAILSIFIAVIIQLTIPNLSDEEAKIPILLTVGLIATTLFNLAYGAFLGLIAQFIGKIFSRQS